MAEHERVLYLPNGPESPPDAMVTPYLPMPGCVIVRPLDCKIINGIWQVEHDWGCSAQRDCGHVLAAGEGVPLEVGDFVAYRPYDGLWLDRGSRIFGLGCPWYDQIVGKIAGSQVKPRFEPLHDWCLVHFELVTALFTPFPVHYSRGTIIAIGSEVSSSLLRKRVEIKKYLAPGGKLDHQRNLDFKFGFASQSWGLIPVSEVLATYNISK